MIEGIERKSWVLIVAILLGLWCTVAAAKIIYVDDSTNGLNDGSSWADAYNYLQDALTDANSAVKPVEIRVAQGIYKPDQGVGQTPGNRDATFQLINGVTIKGGYAGFGRLNPDDRDIESLKTVFSGDLNGDDGTKFTNYGDNSYHVVTGSGTDLTAVLDGLTITGGNAASYPSDCGGGINNINGSPCVTNCKFTVNSSEYRGGGMCNYGFSNPVVTNCVFERNRANNCGGGTYNEASSPTLINCTFTENNARYSGGGVFNEGKCSIKMTNCTFSKNSADSGGGMSDTEYSYSTMNDCTFTENTAGRGGGMLLDGSSMLTNCTFCGNSGGNGGGLTCDGHKSTPTLINCRFIANSAARGGGVYTYECISVPPSCLFSNCIFIGNSATVEGGGMDIKSSVVRLMNCTFTDNLSEGTGGGIYNWAPPHTVYPILTNCLLWNNRDRYGVTESAQFEGTAPTINYCCIQYWSGKFGGIGNIGNNPLLAPDSYHLKQGSPCIDTGDPAGNYTEQTDIDGQPRITGGRVDIGADEFHPQTPIIAVSPTNFDLFCPEGGPSPQPQILSVWNSFIGTLNWNITENYDWLDVLPASGQSSGQITNVVINIDANNLQRGIYTSKLQVSDPNAVNSPQFVTINLDVRPPMIGIEPNELNFISPREGPDPEPKVLSIWNDDIGILNWEISENCNWAEVWPTSGKSSGDVNKVIVCTDVNGLDWGKYSCVLTVSDPKAGNTPQYVTVNLDVRRPLISIEPNQLKFICPLDGPNPASQELSIRNADVGILHWQITEDCNWLYVSPLCGSSAGETNKVIASIDATGISAGEHSCQLIVSDPDANNTPQHVIVRLDVRRPIIGVAPATFEIVYPYGDPNFTPLKLSIWNTDIGTLNWNITADCNWLQVEPRSGKSSGEPNEVSIIVDASGFELGTYSCMLTISDQNAANSPQTVPVRLHVCDKTVYVPEQFPTIQDGIDHTLEGGILIVAEGTYTGPGNYNIDFKGKAITVRSTDPNDPDVVANTIIDCNSLGRGFYFHSEEDSNSILAGLTITNGYADNGGAIFCRYSSPVISNCFITCNRTSSPYGNGGGVWSNDSSLTLCNCEITNNFAGCFGGGIYSGYGNVHILNCTVSSNVAVDRGGGIFNSHTYPTVTNCVISGNRSGNNGGGYHCWGRDSKITNCTISGNTALNNGGGIYSTYGNKVTLVNCILWGDSAKLGRELAVCADDNVRSTASVSFCDLLGGQAEVYIASGCTLNWGKGNVDNDPCFALPGYWVHKNDPNIIVEPNDPNAIWIDGDYHLKSQVGRCDSNEERWTKDAVTSLCIDVGDPNSDWTKELWPNGKRINIGAYGGTPQASMSLNSIGNIADLNLDGFRYFGDLELFVYKWLYEEHFLPEDLNRDGLVDFYDFAMLSANWEEPPFPGLPSDPNPGDGAIKVPISPVLSWTAGSNTLQHSVFFGTSSPLVFQGTQSETTFVPGTLAKDTWHYWRIDEVNPRGVTLGPVWSFKTVCPPDQASNPNPANGATNVNINVVLTWTPGVGATSHDVYLGTQSPGTFQRNQTEITFVPGTLRSGKKYYWRIDEVNSDGKTTGTVWSFTTGGKTICFPGDTLVWLDGTPVKISEVLPSQRASIFGNILPKIYSRQIECIEEHQGAFECYDIMLETGNSISVADNHYFLIDSDRWVSVHELTRGLRLQSLNGPIAIKCVVKRATPLVGKVYNLKIKNSDRYFVGNDGVIVRDY